MPVSTPANRPPMFPIFLDLAGRRCVVIGAGAVAEQKIRGLVAAGARLRVIAPHATPYLQRLARWKKISWQRREFAAGDLEGALLVVAATSSPSTHAKIYREARRRKVLCNVVDVPPECDFYYPAIVRRGSLQIAISTGGQSPALAQRLRRHLETELSPHYSRWVAELGRKRRRAQLGEPDITRRAGLAHAAVEEGFANLHPKLHSKLDR
jgi:precorrin-2 dehydrogenase/sirohydrochlorin ferrochelatase